MESILIKTSIFLLWIGAVLDPVGKFYIRYFALGSAGLTIIYLFGMGKINIFENDEETYSKLNFEVTFSNQKELHFPLK